MILWLVEREQYCYSYR